MRQSRNQFNPKPRPGGSIGNERPAAGRPAQPKLRPRSKPPAGPAVFEPKQPAGRKQRRRMLKAAVWRLAKLIHVAPAALLAMELSAMEDLIEQKCPPGNPLLRGDRGNAMRLAAKLERLRR